MSTVVHIAASPASSTPVPTKNTRSRKLRTKKHSSIELDGIAEGEEEDGNGNDALSDSEETVEETPSMHDILNESDEDEDSDMDIDAEHAQSQRQRFKNKKKSDTKNTIKESDEMTQMSEDEASEEEEEEAQTKKNRRRVRKRSRKKSKNLQHGKKNLKKDTKKKNGKKANRVSLDEENENETADEEEDVDMSDGEAVESGSDEKATVKATKKRSRFHLEFGLKTSPPKKRLKLNKNVWLKVGRKEVRGRVGEIKDDKVLIRYKMEEGSKEKEQQKWVKQSSSKVRMIQKGA